ALSRTAPTRPAGRRRAAASPRAGAPLHCAPPERAAVASSSSLRRDGAPADVAAAESLGPADAVDDGVGLVARHAHVLAPGDDSEHAAAIGEEPPVDALGAGMEDLDRGIALRRLAEALDLGALHGITGIALGGEHDGDRAVGIPAQVEAVE